MPHESVGVAVQAAVTDSVTENKPPFVVRKSYEG